MRSFSPPFSDLWATRPACLQIWAAMSLCGRPAAEKSGIFCLCAHAIPSVFSFQGQSCLGLRGPAVGCRGLSLGELAWVQGRAAGLRWRRSTLTAGRPRTGCTTAQQDSAPASDGVHGVDGGDACLDHLLGIGALCGVDRRAVDVQEGLCQHCGPAAIQIKPRCAGPTAPWLARQHEGCIVGG